MSAPTAPSTGRTLIAVMCVALILPATLLAQEWPRFRGPDAAGITSSPDDPALPDTWSTTENVGWRTEIPGVGWSSPVVWGRTVFVTARH